MSILQEAQRATFDHDLLRWKSRDYHFHLLMDVALAYPGTYPRLFRYAERYTDPKTTAVRRYKMMISLTGRLKRHLRDDGHLCPVAPTQAIRGIRHFIKAEDDERLLTPTELKITRLGEEHQRLRDHTSLEHRVQTWDATADAVKPARKQNAEAFARHREQLKGTIERQDRVEKNLKLA
jgi:hypothetical protein